MVAALTISGGGDLVGVFRMLDVIESGADHRLGDLGQRTLTLLHQVHEIVENGDITITAAAGHGRQQSGGGAAGQGRPPPRILQGFGA